MPWGAAIGAVGSIAAAKMGKDKNGGAGTSTASKEPWMGAQQNIYQSLGQGQALMEDYTANPFTQGQLNAYNNQYALSDAARQIVPGLLAQMNAQPLGYDPDNPKAKAKAYDFQPGLLQFANVNGAGSPTSAVDLLARGKDFANQNWRAVSGAK